MNGFCEVLTDLGLHEVASKGPKFTWLNKRRGRDTIFEKLDRFVANSDWLSLFPTTKTLNLDFLHSDHRPVKLVFENRPYWRQDISSRRFKFENKWLLEDGFMDVVKEAWSGNEGINIAACLSRGSVRLGL